MGAMALSIGIAIQNFPEGAIISMPLRSEGMGKTKAFAGGVLSGIVEPVGAVLTIPVSYTHLYTEKSANFRARRGFLRDLSGEKRTF